MQPEHSEIHMALSGLNVVELAGLAPGPFAGLVLSDFGASVIRVDNPTVNDTDIDVLCRDKRSIVLDLKTPAGREVAIKLISRADILIDTYRPGVLERLGLGPDIFLNSMSGLNTRLVYARVLGFDPRGPHGRMAGHDLNYLAVSGVLSMMPPQDSTGRPSFPLNLLADMAGGGLSAVVGILLALHERSKSNIGQVVENNMVAGTRYLASFPLIHAKMNSGLFHVPAGSGVLDSGAPFYNTYRCKDGGFMSLACIERRFFEIFIQHFTHALPQRFGLDYRPTTASHSNREEWPKLFRYLRDGFLTQTRDEWTQIFNNTDSCALPVLLPDEVEGHSEASPPGLLPPTPHPHLSRTPSRIQQPPKYETLIPGTHTNEIMRELDMYESRAENGKPMIKSKL